MARCCDHAEVTIADDTEWGAFRDGGPWVLDREDLQWYPVAGLLRQAAKAGVPALTRPRRVPPGLRVVAVAGRLDRCDRRRGGCARDATATRRPRPAAPTSPAGCAAPPSGSARPTSSSARSSPAARDCSPRSWSASSSSAATRCRPSRSTTVRKVVEEDLGVPLEIGLRLVRSRAAGRRVDRPGARGHAAHRRGGRRQGAATQRGPAGAQGPAGDGVAGAAPRRPDPDRLAGQPAGAGRAVRRDHRRGARLPHGGGQHDRHRRRCSTSSADRATSCPARTRRWSPAACW